MKTKQYIKEHILQLIIIVGMIIFGIFSFKSCGKYTNPQNHSDTTHTVYYEHHDTTIITKPVVINTYHHDSHTDSVQYTASTNYDTLRTQYDSLKNAFLAYNVHSDSAKVDTLGSITIIDTVHKNLIIGRSIHPNFIVPVKTTTINNYIYPKPKAKFYLGGNIQGSQTDVLQGVGLGTIYQSKNDAIWGATANYNFKTGISYQLSRYFKIQLHK